MTSDINGKRVLITGSSTGIGAALANKFAQLGASVAVHCNRSIAQGQAVVDAITAAGGTAILVTGDLCDPVAAEKIPQDAADALGGLDILINNAGAAGGPVTNAEFPAETYHHILNLNLHSVFHVTKGAYPFLKAAENGVIINTGSIAGKTGGPPGAAAYSAAKAAVHSVSRNAAAEFAPDGIRVNTVAPGFIETPFHVGTPPEVREHLKNITPLGRIGTPEDCVGAYVFLASNEMSGFITGQIINVNGGLAFN